MRKKLNQCHIYENKEILPEYSNREETEILENGIVGLYVHIKKPDGKIGNGYVYQGRVIGVMNDYALVQTFSWLDGSDYNILSFPLDFLLAWDNAVFYHTSEDMKDYRERKPAMFEV